MRGIKIFGSLEICLLLFGYFGISQKVDGYTCMTRLAVATNTRRRYVMVVGSKPVTLEYVVARLHHARIVDVYIGYVYPCAHQMGAHVKPMRLHIVNVFLKQHHCLHIRAMALCLVFAKAKAVQTEAFVKIGCLNEYGYL